MVSEETKEIEEHELFISIRSLLIDTFHFSGEITYDTIINKEMYGDDALEFIDEFCDKFKIDMTEFNFNDYFGPETGINIILFLYYLLFNRKKLKCVPIRICDLVQIALKHKWIILSDDSATDHSK